LIRTETDSVASRYRRNRHRYGAHELILREVPPGSRVLDVGCATGYLAESLRATGCRAWGIDKDAEAVSIAAGSYEEAHVVDLEESDELPLAEGFFDVVLCADVVEHLRSPERGLRLVRRYLAPHGLLIVSVPNVAHFSVRIPIIFGRFEYAPSGILDVTHARLFTFATARRLVENAGFDVRREFGASDRFGGMLQVLGRASRPLRGLLAYNIVIVATRSGERVPGAQDPGTNRAER
jgi:2-polyprenyl-3-methyl-5-hydroxy-6-metoxy-1,4-benzoquinol methylase